MEALGDLLTNGFYTRVQALLHALLVHVPTQPHTGTALKQVEQPAAGRERTGAHL